MSQDNRRQYTPEFKLDAAKLVVEQGYTFPEAAKRLGVSLQTLKTG